MKTLKELEAKQASFVNLKKTVLALMMGLAVATTACNDDDSPSNDDDKYTDKSYGALAISDCGQICDNLEAANAKIQRANLDEKQEAYLRDVVSGIVDNVIIPTYTILADNTEKLEGVLAGLTVDKLTQEEINKACEYFGNARQWWELSEAFLGGAASDFSVDPTIDSWPLSRSSLLNYFRTMDPQALEEDESILGFHALEFILFRNGQPRKVAEFKANDTYNGFESIAGDKELIYAQQVCTLLKQRTFQLQVAWQGATAANAARVETVKAAGLDYVTLKGLSYGDDLKQAGSANSKYATLKAAVAQLLSTDEGSALAIANEVGTAKIANPFTAGEISYVESPYSHRSIIDFQDNIRSIQNVWYGNTDGRDKGGKSFYSFFAETNNGDINSSVTSSINDAINSIGSMPAPFVEYCSVVHGKIFSEEEYTEDEE